MSGGEHAVHLRIQEEGREALSDTQTFAELRRGGRRAHAPSVSVPVVCSPAPHTCAYLPARRGRVVHQDGSPGASLRPHTFLSSVSPLYLLWGQSCPSSRLLLPGQRHHRTWFPAFSKQLAPALLRRDEKNCYSARESVDRS